MRRCIAVAVVFVAFGHRLEVQQKDTYLVLRTLDGGAYTNAEVQSVSPTNLTVFFDGGGARIPFTNLPVYIQKKYHYDPVKATQLMAQESQRMAAFLSAQRETNRLAFIAANADSELKVDLDEFRDYASWDSRHKIFPTITSGTLRFEVHHLNDGEFHLDYYAILSKSEIRMWTNSYGILFACPRSRPKP